MACFDDTFLDTQIAYFEALIASLQAAITALSTDEVQSYTLNTGQTSQTVTKKNLMALNNQLDWAYGRLEFFCMRKNGGATIYARPGC